MHTCLTYKEFELLISNIMQLEYIETCIILGSSDNILRRRTSVKSKLKTVELGNCSDYLEHNL